MSLTALIDDEKVTSLGWSDQLPST